MHNREIIVLVVLLWLTQCSMGDAEVDLFRRAVTALQKSLKYMEDHSSEINLDGALGCKLAQEHLEIFMTTNPGIFQVLGEDMRNTFMELVKKASDTVRKSIPYLEYNDPKYFKALGGLLYPSEVIAWHPSKRTDPSLKEDPLRCPFADFNETFSDICLQEIIGSKNIKDRRCDVSKSCYKYMTRPKERDYMITHQVLFLQTLEKYNCLKFIKELDSEKLTNLQDYLCTNIMRDAEIIAENKFPGSHQDIFMEQIGLCGIWGYSDFYKHGWLEAILEWQRPEGCFDRTRGWYCTDDLKPDARYRVKRNEVELPDGCFAHKTAVAIIALAVSIRFSAESIASYYLPDLNP